MGWKTFDRRNEEEQFSALEANGVARVFLSISLPKTFKKLVQIPGPRFGNVSFDGFYGIPWDFKAHAINTSSHQVIVNDSQAIADAIQKYGAVGVIIAMGEVTYNDKKRSFQRWHNRFKGGTSKYEKQRIERGAWSRLRKTFFDLRQIVMLRINDKTLVKTGSFQIDFRNSDGSPRRSKVLIDLEKAESDILTTVDF